MRVNTSNTEYINFNVINETKYISDKLEYISMKDTRNIVMTSNTMRRIPEHAEGIRKKQREYGNFEGDP
jgi:hypothetical protein